MITIRELARRDRAVAAITSEECHFMADILVWVASLADSWPMKYLVPEKIRVKSLNMRMLAATLGRTQEEARSIQAQIEKDMRDAR